MCGIFGGIDTHFDEHTLGRLAHRGPDQQSLVRQAGTGGITVTLGQTRLNVVDRHDVGLPIATRGATILFNGEIYNHLELRDELVALGWSFETRTDTEVALAAYLQWGRQCLDRFNGMFALAVWNGRELFCARDRLGQKPLFYRYGGGRFELASEIKAFEPLAPCAVDAFDLFEFCFDRDTLFDGVLALSPGHYLIYDVERGSCTTAAWWDIEHQADGKITDEAEAVDKLIELLEDAVRLRLRADVPIGLFLSGGIDSALIAKLSGVERAFTCQFEEFRGLIDEERYARDLGQRLGIEVEIITPGRERFLELLPTLAYHLEMPTGSFSVYPLYCLAEAARAAGCPVVLSGEGADELFLGYVRNELLLAASTVELDPKRQQYAAMLGRYHGGPLDRFCRMASRSGLAGAALMKTFLGPRWNPRRSMHDNVSYLESRIFLQPLLQMGDRMTMAHGVEARCPFLDHRLVALAFSLDDRLRVRDGTGKWLLRRAAERLLPAGALMLGRRVKHGLPTPVNLWMQGRHSFDRKYWNALLTAECMKSLLGEREP